MSRTAPCMEASAISVWMCEWMTCIVKSIKSSLTTDFICFPSVSAHSRKSTIKGAKTTAAFTSGRQKSVFTWGLCQVNMNICCLRLLSKWLLLTFFWWGRSDCVRLCCKVHVLPVKVWRIKLWQITHWRQLKSEVCVAAADLSRDFTLVSSLKYESCTGPRMKYDFVFWQLTNEDGVCLYYSLQGFNN